MDNRIGDCKRWCGDFGAKLWDVADDAQSSAKEAFDPKTLMVRSLLVFAPATAMLAVFLACMLDDRHCEEMGIKSRTLIGLVVGVPVAPFVHLTWHQLWIDVIGWCTLSSSLTEHGPGFFVTACIFLYLLSGIGAWLFGAGGVYHVGTAGILFGMFAFRLCILPFKRPLTWIDIGYFCVFDLGFGGIWWANNYHAPGNSTVLAASGFVAGVLFAWIHFQKFGGSLHAQTTALNEQVPLLGSSLRFAQEATENAATTAADGGIRQISAASAAAQEGSPSSLSAWFKPAAGSGP